jgi:hypothetical protein
MKSKTIIMLVACAIITLSFSIIKVDSAKVNQKAETVRLNEPIGGMAIEDKI